VVTDYLFIPVFFNKNEMDLTTHIHGTIGKKIIIVIICLLLGNYSTPFQNHVIVHTQQHDIIIVEAHILHAVETAQWPVKAVV
jgi:hypothetical protein